MFKKRKWMLFATSLLMSGCISLGEQTQEASKMLPPLLNQSIITTNWQYVDVSNDVIVLEGEWLHLPADEVVNLLVYINNLEQRE